MRIPLVDLSRQHVEIEAAIETGMRRLFRSTAYIKGPDVELFEREFASFCDVKHCVGVGNGTDALELSVRALGLSRGDKVIVPANSFIASAMAVLRAGADVTLVDCDPETYLIDVEQVDSSLTTDVRAIMPVHLYGQTAPVDEIRQIAPGIPIVEDAAQSQGATRNGHPAGSLGTIAGTSFYPGKNIGAYGDAGAVLTNEDEVAEAVSRLGNWGSDTKYEHPVPGFNSRLDTIQAVVLRTKLARLQAWNEQRVAAARRYTQLLSDTEQVALPSTLPGNHHVWHVYVVRVPDRDRVLRELHEAGIGAGVHYPIPMHLQGALSDLGYKPGDFPVTERAAGEILSLPVFPGITENEQDYVASRLKESVARSGLRRG